MNGMNLPLCVSVLSLVGGAGQCVCVVWVCLGPTVHCFREGSTVCP